LALKGKIPSDESYTDTVDGSEKQIYYFSTDSELAYWNFFLDFGPLNLGQLYRFCAKLNETIAKFPGNSHIICFYSSSDTSKRANAIFLICSWQIIYLNRSPEEALNGFRLALPDVSFSEPKVRTNKRSFSIPPLRLRDNPTISPLPPFHDASPCSCSFIITVLDCLRGLAKARMHGFFDFETFDVEEYEHFEQVEVSPKYDW